MPAEMTNTNGSHDTKNVIESWFGNQRVFLLKCTSQCMLGKILKSSENTRIISQNAVSRQQTTSRGNNFPYPAWKQRY
jgi:hypothetical protein